MKTKAVLCLGAVALVGVAAAAVVAANEDARKKAYEFTLPDLHGKNFSLKDCQGRIVVLEWVNKGCPVWAGKVGLLNKTYKDYVDKGVVWLGIDSTHHVKAEDNLIYMVRNDVTKPILLDPDGKVGKAYDARTTPHMFIVDKEGKIAYDGDINENRRGDGGKNFVAQALDELLAGKPVSEPKTNPNGCTVKYKE